MFSVGTLRAPWLDTASIMGSIPSTDGTGEDSDAQARYVVPTLLSRSPTQPPLVHRIASVTMLASSWAGGYRLLISLVIPGWASHRNGSHL